MAQSILYFLVIYIELNNDGLGKLVRLPTKYSYSAGLARPAGIGMQPIRVHGHPGAHRPQAHSLTPSRAQRTPFTAPRRGVSAHSLGDRCRCCCAAPPSSASTSTVPIFPHPLVLSPLSYGAFSTFESVHPIWSA